MAIDLPNLTTLGELARSAAPALRAVQRLPQLLWPGVCLLCRQRSERDIDLCVACEAALEVNDSACWRCGEPVASTATDGLCGACIASPPPWHRTLAPFRYGGPMASVIGGLKVGHGRRQARALGALTAARIAAGYAQSSPAPSPDGGGQSPITAMPTAIVPMPLTRQRRRQRGFNQAELLAAAVGRALGLRQHKNCLVRVRNAPPQRTLTRAARLRNLRGAFAVRRPLPSKRLALLDDVATTGATARAATEALLAAGAEEVHVWVVAKTPAPA